MFDLSPTTLALAALPYGIILFDQRQRACFLNRAAAQLLEVDIDQYLGTPFLAFCQALHLAEPLGSEKQIVSHNAELLAVQTLPLPPQAAQGRLSQAVLLSAETEANTVSILSHELRSPITVIRGFAEMLLRDMVGPLQAEQHELVTAIHDRAGDLAQIINQSLVLNDLQYASQIPYSEVDLGALISAVASQLQTVHQKTGVSCTVELPPARLSAHTREHLLRIILTQIIDNAFRFTPPEGRITVAAHPAARGVRITIQDTGIGIPQEYQEHVFKRYTWIPSHPIKVRRGLGLGLAIVQACCDHNNSSVTFQSTAGVGTTFVVEVGGGKHR